MTAIRIVAGRGLPIRGDDIDTDRIMPARFLKAVSFEGLERHLFEDDRAADPTHPFNDPRYAGAAILIVNKNFGCGSSREHAPQGLFRFGIRAIVGESFSEIFQGNASMIGLPCFAADHASVDRLQAAIERSIHRSQQMLAARQHGPQRLATGYADVAVILAIDGLQPEQGHETLYVGLPCKFDFHGSWCSRGA